jgi:hypothetical protein
VGKRAGISVSVGVGMLGCVTVGVTGWGGMWLGGSRRGFDSHQLNCAFIFSFLFFFRFVIPHMFICSYVHMFICSYFIFRIF